MRVLPLILLAVLSTNAAPSRVNVVFILSDDQAPTAFGFANPDLKTPHLDRLFREGAHLQNAFVTTPSGSSSRASLLTSRYGSEMGITDWINTGRERQLGLPGQLVTWPEAFQQKGYRTGLVGKWHLGMVDRYHPTKHGFHFFAGMRGGGNTAKDPVLEIEGKRRQVTGYTPDLLTDQAIGFIQRNREGPFALCLHFRAPHTDWLPVPEQDMAPYRDLDPKLPELPHLDTKKLKRWIREYYASVSSVDRNLGRLLAELDRLKLRDNTVVIFSSDHGYFTGQKGLWFKGNARRQLTRMPDQEWKYIPPAQRPNLFDQALRTPAAIRWPGVIQPGTIVNESLSNLDWYPTLLELAGIQRPRITLRGRSFVSRLHGTPGEWDNELHLEYSMKHMAQTHMRGRRTPQWKYSVDFLHPGRVELYDLEKDPGEHRNLASSTAHADIRSELHAKVIARMREIGDTVDQDPTRGIALDGAGGTDTARGWELSFKAGRVAESGSIHATEIMHLVPHRGRLYAANGYWMDARPGANTRTYAQVLALDAPAAGWKIDLQLNYKHTKMTALKSLRFEAGESVLLAGSDGEQASSIWTRDDEKNTWIKTTFQQGGQFKRSTRAFIVHRNQLFIAAGELGIYRGVYDPDLPGKLRIDEKPELGPGVVRPMSFAQANGRLFASSGTSIFRRDDQTKQWAEVYRAPGKTSWAMGGIRGLTTVASPNGKMQSLLFFFRGRMVRLDAARSDTWQASDELDIRSRMQEHLGRPVAGHLLAAYSDMLPLTDPRTGKTVHLIGVQSQLEGDRGESGNAPDTFHGYYKGGAYLVREAIDRYRVREVNERWRTGKPALLAPRAYARSPFPSEKDQLYFGGYDANFLPAVDSAWIMRASIDTALKIPKPAFELRSYTCNEGRMEALRARFRDHTLGYFKKHGMHSIGYWTPEKPNTLVYLLKHRDRDAAEASWQALEADPAWKAVVKTSNRDGRLLAGPPERMFLNETGYSPGAAVNPKDEGVYELRTYTCHPGKLDALHARFREHTLPLFERQGMTSIAYWTPEDKPEANTTLVYLLKHRSRAAAAASWTAFRADPEWLKVAANSRKDGPILDGKPVSAFMQATDFSPVLPD